LKINGKKTKAMLINLNATIYCENEPIEAVNEFKYLGLCIKKDSKSPNAILEDRL
jgi:hypothetical protein